MITLVYPIAVALGLLAVALAGLATHKHFIVIMLGIELIFVASTIALLAFFSYSNTLNPGGIFLLLTIWAIASVEIITLIAFYVYMKERGINFDISKLSKLKW